MKTFARIENGRVVEVIAPMTYEIDAPDPTDPTDVPNGWPTFKAGEEVPIERRFPPDLVASLVEITGADVKEGYTYSGGVFAPYVAPPPSPEVILVANKAMRDDLLQTAAERIAPLQDAVDLEVATASETSALTSWKEYRVAVNRVDLTLAAPAWPPAPA